MTEMSWHQEEAAGLHTRPFDIVGYVYRADLYCPGCVHRPLRGHPVLYAGDPSEVYLDRLAGYEGINRDDESSFDSGEFPKLLLRSDCGPDDRCGSCGEVIAWTA